MSKNIFNVLATHDDSEDESRIGQKRTQAKPTDVKRDTKKEARAKDVQLREKYGDQVEKEARPPRSNMKPKDDYAPYEKRPYERHSGTGRPAFKKNDYKKGGHGKGNVGGVEGENTEAVNNTEETETNVNLVKLPEEEIVTLDDYMTNTGATFGIKGEGQGVKLKDPKAFEDANTKAIISKRTQQEAENKKALKVQDKKQVNKNIIEIDVTAQRRRDNRQGAKKGYVKYDKTEFPTLD